MSPEQAESREIGPASDVFSLGSVLAFAAAGTAPFDGGDMLSVIYRIVHAEPDLSRLPPALAGLIAGCLAKDPAARPSLDALLGTVTATAESFPENAPGQFWPDPVAGVIARQAGPALLSDAGIGGQAAYGPPGAHPVTRYPAQQAGTTAPPAPQPTTVPGGRPSSRRWLLAIAAAGVVAAGAGATLALVAAPGSSTSANTGAASPGAASTGGPGSSSQAAGPATAAGTTSAAATSPPASSPATAPPASPSSSLIAVTVCTFPADGCTQPGASQYMEVKPKEITTSGDGSGFVTNLVWSNWGAPHATATGVMKLNDCTPNCAEGKYTSYPATVTLAGLTPYGTDLEAYSTIVVESDAANTTETYTKDTVPTS
jgi:hypothetical protein